MIILFRIFLFPFSFLYGLLLTIRNYLYDIGHFKSFDFDVPVISIGNLNVGGSGKTPMAEYVIHLFKSTHQITVLSRGYGRRTRGFRIATEADHAMTIGDEPFQLYRKFKGEINVAVGEDRSLAIPTILNELPETNLIILDDAFQHRSVRPLFSILVTDYHRPFFKDYVLPSGRLRERRKGASRADAVVVTKCPDGVPRDEIDAVVQEIKSYNSNHTYFSGIQYDKPLAFNGIPASISKDVILVTGIANSDTMVEYCGSKLNIIKHFDFSDHHRYTIDDLKKILGFQQKNNDTISVLTTEKDRERLLVPGVKDFIKWDSWFYLPMRMFFFDNGSDFDNELTSSVSSFHEKDAL